MDEEQGPIHQTTRTAGAVRRVYAPQPMLHITAGIMVGIGDHTPSGG
jgi:hypothetical protein